MFGILFFGFIILGSFTFVVAASVASVKLNCTPRRNTNNNNKSCIIVPLKQKMYTNYGPNGQITTDYYKKYKNHWNYTYK